MKRVQGIAAVLGVVALTSSAMAGVTVSQGGVYPPLGTSLDFEGADAEPIAPLAGQPWETSHGVRFPYANMYYYSPLSDLMGPTSSGGVVNASFGNLKMHFPDGVTELTFDVAAAKPTPFGEVAIYIDTDNTSDDNSPGPYAGDLLNVYNGVTGDASVNVVADSGTVIYAVTVSGGQPYTAVDNLTWTTAGPTIPTVSEWGLVAMLLVALAAGTIAFGRRIKPSLA